jgi:hypothetical protein
MMKNIAPLNRVATTKGYRAKNPKKCEPQIYVNGKKYYGNIDDIPIHIIRHVEIIEKSDVPRAPISRTSNNIKIRTKLKHRNDIKFINPELFKKRKSPEIN